MNISIKSFFIGILYAFVGMVLVPLILFYVNQQLELVSFSNLLTIFVGLFLLVLGTNILLFSVLEFLKNSESPLPFDKPKKLVTTGIFQATRNPMFLASSFIWLGEALVFGSLLLYLYALLFTLFNHYILVAKDEPMLKKKFGRKYISYQKEVPRYVPTMYNRAK